MITKHPKEELTFVLIKPDAIQRSFIGDIISRFERTGLKMIATKMLLPREDQCWAHYNKTDEWFTEKGTKTIENLKSLNMPITKSALDYGKDILRGNVTFLTSGPVICMVWKGNQAVGVIKKLVGSTEPLTSDVGTIRGDFTLDSYELANMEGRAVKNLIHCSDKQDEALREMKIWLTESDMFEYKTIQEHVLYHN